MERKKIKICYILPFYEEGTDTHLFYNYELIKKLAARNEIDLYLIIEKNDNNNSISKIAGELGAKLYLQKFKFPPFRFLELFWQCIKMMKNNYHEFYVHYSYYGALAAFFAGGNVFYWNRGMPWLFERKWFEEKVFRFILKNTILVTGPESLAKEYRERYGVRHYRVLSNWVDVKRFRSKDGSADAPSSLILASPARGSEGSARFRSSQESAGSETVPKTAENPFRRSSAAPSKTVLFVHHLSKRKGADLIPEIAKGFGDDVLFLVAGDGPEKENLEKCGLSNVEVLGKIPNSEIVKYFQVADVFLMPSREEGSPHVLLETMAAGVPFVASDIGGVKEIVPKSLENLLCASEDVKCFQTKIKTLLSDELLYNKTKQECLAAAKNFDVLRGVEEFINLFKL